MFPFTTTYLEFLLIWIFQASNFKIKVESIKGGFMKFPNDSKVGCIDKGYPKNIQIFKGGESNSGKFQF